MTNPNATQPLIIIGNEPHFSKVVRLFCLQDFVDLYGMEHPNYPAVSAWFFRNTEPLILLEPVQVVSST